MFNDHVTKLSTLDLIIIQTNSKIQSSQSLYNSFMYDSILALSVNNFNTLFFLQNEYQEPLNTILLIAPETSTVFYNFLNLYLMPTIFDVTPSVVFDIFTNNLNFYYGDGVVQFFLFFLYVYFFIYFFSTSISLKWSLFFNAHFTRFYYYFYSISKETRIQFEALTQTAIFFVIY
jgi:hypothetical protein